MRLKMKFQLLFVFLIIFNVQAGVLGEKVEDDIKCEKMNSELILCNQSEFYMLDSNFTLLYSHQKSNEINSSTIYQDKNEYNNVYDMNNGSNGISK